MKAAHPSLSVCEVGAAIGKMWREMIETEKQRYNEDFAIDKVLRILFQNAVVSFYSSIVKIIVAVWENTSNGGILSADISCIHLTVYFTHVHNFFNSYNYSHWSDL